MGEARAARVGKGMGGHRGAGCVKDRYGVSGRGASF